MKKEKLTYGKLEHVLRKLAFDRLENSPYRLYRNREHDSVIALPNLADTEVVDQAHLSGVTTNLIYKGVVKDKSMLDQYFTENINIRKQQKKQSLESRRAKASKNAQK
jgi:hypothetical protein